MFENVDLEYLDKLTQYVNSEFDGCLIYLPIKPNTMIYIVNEIRVINEDIEDANLIPNGCANYFTEVCSECPFFEKECKRVGIPQKVWFHLDSPYITFIQQYWNKFAFNDYDKCLSACYENFGKELVDDVLSKIEG